MTNYVLITVLILLSFNVFSLVPNEEKFLKETVTTLASKEFAGRRPGTPGGEKATEYLIKTIRSFNISDTPEFKDYKQEFTVFTGMKKNGLNQLVVNKTSKLDFEPTAFSLSGNLENSEMVFAGFGISIPENDPTLKYDDYKNIDVKGKVVVILSGDPGTGNQQSLFRKAEYFSYRSIHYKLNNAMIHGAVGALVIQDPLSLNNPSKAPELFFNSEEGGGNRISIVAGHMKHTDFDMILKKYNHNLLSLQQQIAKTQKPFSFALKNDQADMSVQLKKETGRVSNVVVYLPGSDETLKKEVIVLGGHYDHLGMGGSSSLDTDRTPKIHHGADDNASGTALSLALLKNISKRKLKRSLMFVFFNAEESGLLGSKHFVSSWSRYQESYGEIKAMLNFDMVGRFEDVVTVMGLGSATEWDNMLKTLQGGIQSGTNSHMAIPMKLQQSAVGSSDHSSFIEGKIPALFFTTGAHEDYHRASDTSEKINAKAMNKIYFFAHKLTHILGAGLPLTFDPTILDGSGNDQGGRGYGSRLGCVPEFGQDQSIKGVICTRTSADSPASKAGIQPGDILIGLGDIDINSIYDFAFSLRYYRPGDKLLVRWTREGKEMSAQIILETRQGS